MMKVIGRFNLATNMIVEIARNVCLKMKRIIGIDNQCKPLKKLFDAIVLHVFPYCSEICGVTLSCNDISNIGKKEIY
jgi:hypothetical protein